MLRHSLVPMLSALLATTALSGQETSTWTLHPTLQIGSLDDPETALSHISGIRTDRQGNLYVALSEEATVRVFDPRGRRLRNIGRKGAGPGEFNQITWIGWAGEALVVIDETRNRVSRFTPAGRHMRSEMVAGPLLEYSSRPTSARAALHDGTLLGPPRVGDQQEIERLPLLRMNSRGEVLSTVAHLVHSGAFRSIRMERLQMSLAMPFPRNSLWEVAADGRSVVVVHRPVATGPDPSHFLLEAYDPDGTQRFSRRFRYTPRRITQAEADAALAVHVPLLSRALPVPVVQRLLRDSVPIPQFHPPVMEMATSTDGSVWLRRSGGGNQETEWLVHAADGRLLATVKAPGNIRIMHAEADAVWGVVHDESDVPFVIRYAIRRS